MEFQLRTKINATASQIYQAWLSSDGHTKMTGGAATITNNVGDSFTAWDGYIEGRNIKLDSNKRIVQAWRTTQFEENEADSQIEILLKEVDGITELTLNHSNVPDSGEHYKNGWENHYFQPMKEYFSN